MGRPEAAGFLLSSILAKRISRRSPTIEGAKPSDMTRKLFAVVLEGSHEFSAFDCTDNKAWKGIIVHPIAIEVDQKSLIDIDRYDAPAGCLLRKGDTLSIAARADPGFRVTQRWKLIEGLPSAGEEVEIGFARWSVVIGAGQDKRVLFTVDRLKPKGD